ncbi:MAG: hypothetical protein V4489_04170 [Chlamydiota bacterium]
MQSSVRIALVGDYSATSLAHQGIPLSIDLAAKALNTEVSFSWIPTKSLDSTTLPHLLEYHGIWCVPGSPYENMEGVLEAIKIARENKIPFLGTCGGFQHTVLEYARNVLLLPRSDHLESNPKTSFALISPLTCSLLSQIERIYGEKHIFEMFNCNYGVNPAYQYLLEKHSELHITGVDQSKNVRVVELKSHPFFIATLYQPERLALTGSCHPLIKAFIEAATKSVHDKTKTI